MATFKKQWADLLDYSIAITAGLVLTLSALVVLMFIVIAVLIAKLLVFIK